MSSIKIRSKRINNQTQIRTLISHPMENGRRKDPQGNLIPAHHIQELTVKHNSHIVANCYMAGGVSKNPYFDFLLNEALPGDEITISWIDNLGETDTKLHILK